MKNSLIRRALAVPAALLLVSLFVAASARAQAPVDDSKTVVKTNKITDNFYTVDGRGGTIGVLVGPQGTFMVDTQFAPLTDRIVAAIKQISPNPIRFVVNTHVHPDHTGGNANMGKLGATIFARDELRDRLMNPPPGANGQPGTPMLRRSVFRSSLMKTKLRFTWTGKRWTSSPSAKAHTDGDTMVYFHNADVIMTGDFYRSIGYPNIDRVNGGSLERDDRRALPGDRTGRAEYENYSGTRSDRGQECRHRASGHDPGRAGPGCEAYEAGEDVGRSYCRASLRHIRCQRSSCRAERG